MRTLTVEESKTSVLELTFAQATALNAAGRRLVSQKTWWGGGEEDHDKTVIRCRHIGDEKWETRVSDAVGVVSVGDVQIRVKPKIPSNHLFYLLSASGQVPRLDDQRAFVEAGDNLLDLIARWYVGSLEQVLRLDLIRDYSPQRDFIREKRGRIEPLATARKYYSGRIGFECEFDEFSVDTPMNRVLRAAVVAVLRRPDLGKNLRRRCSWLVARMSEVGMMKLGDIRVKVDRRTAHVRDALALARQVLRWQGRFLEHGSEVAWTFLIRTPEMVEDGLRKLIAERLIGEHTVEKKGRQVPGSKLQFNPDLVIDGGTTVGDIKYKLIGKGWIRSDLYQIMAFGAVFSAEQGIVVAFGEDGTELAPLQAPRLRISNVLWPVDIDSPQKALEVVVKGLSKQLEAVALKTPFSFVATEPSA